MLRGTLVCNVACWGFSVNENEEFWRFRLLPVGVEWWLEALRETDWRDPLFLLDDILNLI